MTVLAFDWGGTGVKFGVWKNEVLAGQGAFPTPATWEELKSEMKAVRMRFSQEEFVGVAISAPGAVDSEAGVIEGISAIPYIHHFPIQAELEEFFGLPVTIENDANSAGIAEVWQGAAQGYQDVLFLVLGTGVGGAVIKAGKVQKGAHLYGGEFGLLFMNETQSFSDVGTAVKMAWRYCKRKNVPAGTYSGKEVFAFAEAGDQVAQEEVDAFYDYLAQGIFGLQFTVDPECIVIGGGVSAKPDLLDQVNKRIEALFLGREIKDFLPTLKVCQFKNDANLIGAVATFYQVHPQNA